MAHKPFGVDPSFSGQRVNVGGEGEWAEGGCELLHRKQYGKSPLAHYADSGIDEVAQDDNFDEDEGIYDELNLDEEEEKFGLAQDDHDSDDSEDTSEGSLPPPTQELC